MIRSRRCVLSTIRNLLHDIMGSERESLLGDSGGVVSLGSGEDAIALLVLIDLIQAVGEYTSGKLESAVDWKALKAQARLVLEHGRVT